MSGKKIELLKHTLRFIVTQMKVKNKNFKILILNFKLFFFSSKKDADRLSIVEFDHAINVLTGLTRMNKFGVDKTQSAIEKIQSQG